ncbi:MAG: tagatose 1,6-diphosphate aldolase [Dehalococcoidia bacterium]|nr:tagatose 1,6-diphosphate aldolase [Dehalococcoidia bacterium]
MKKKVICYGSDVMNISIGKLRGLQQLADSKGIMTMCAIDHRGALKRALNARNPDAVSYQDMVDFKLDLCQAVAPFASAILLDPEYGAAQAIATGLMPGSKGLLVSLEKSGYTGDSGARITELLPGWSVKKIKKMGASAVKLLIYFRPDLKDIASRQLDLVARLADQCLEEDIAFLVEPVSYPIGEAKRINKGGASSRKFAEIKPELVIETARQITTLPIDVLKAEFPADIEFEQDEAKLLELCRMLDRASRLPWVLLSAGVGFDSFRKQVEIACKAGASGFLAGRALWQEGAQIRSRQNRADFFQNTAAPRLKELAEVADRYGKPWHSRLEAEKGKFAPVAEGWYRSY